MQIIGDPIGAVKAKVLISQTHAYKLCRVWYVSRGWETAHNVYNSSRYDIFGRAIIMWQVPKRRGTVHEKKGFETRNAQNKLEIKILLTVKSLLTFIRFSICLGASELTKKIYRATKHYKPRSYPPTDDSLFKGAVSRNSAKLGNYKMPVKSRET